MVVLWSVLWSCWWYYMSVVGRFIFILYNFFFEFKVLNKRKICLYLWWCEWFKLLNKMFGDFMDWKKVLYLGGFCCWFCWIWFCFFWRRLCKRGDVFISFFVWVGLWKCVCSGFSFFCVECCVNVVSFISVYFSDFWREFGGKK